MALAPQRATGDAVEAALESAHRSGGGGSSGGGGKNKKRKGGCGGHGTGHLRGGSANHTVGGLNATDDCDSDGRERGGGSGILGSVSTKTAAFAGGGAFVLLSVAYAVGRHRRRDAAAAQDVPAPLAPVVPMASGQPVALTPAHNGVVVNAGSNGAQKMAAV